MAKKFIFNSKYGGAVEGYLVTNTYANTGNLYIGVMGMDKELGAYTAWTDLSVNIMKLGKGEFAYDANNNYAYNDIIDILQKNGVVKYLGHDIPSGYCKYPVYKVTSKFKQWV